MNIYLTKGSGSAATELSAFDSALYDAGIANYNLLRLSSVIPPKASIIEVDDGKIPIDGVWGDRLYVVMAEYRTSTLGESAWAGVGWVQDGSTGEGLFVEFEGTSEEYVTSSITQSLKDLMATRGIDMGEIHMAVNGVECTGEPVCAMVTAVYKSEPW